MTRSASRPLSQLSESGEHRGGDPVEAVDLPAGQRRHGEGKGAEPDRYAPSPRSFCRAVEPFDYAGDDVERIVDVNGHISFKNRRVKISTRGHDDTRL